MSASFLSIEKLTQEYPDGKGDNFTVFENASFGIEKGEFVCILGHSGCGKSTIMNILAGLAEPTRGVVKMDGVAVSGPSLDRGVVFQNYSLLPWLTALKNVTFGVAARFPDWTKKQVTDHAIKFLEKVGLTGDAIHRKPSQLSGGMRQRVSIARAFANEPKLLLLDEPFGALDALTRGTIQDELIKVWSGTDQTVFMITHDIDEAILLADRILLMTNGPLARVAESVEITIPRPRSRTDIVEHPNYYAIRNHLVHFLGQRSADMAGQPADGTTHSPKTVRIDTTTTTTDPSADHLRAVQ
ncbi:ABC transporter ATP-binding protein [Yoonia sediminilitoris]|uniref:Nitrate/nitrite transport system ATP-binding protein n=1 Tax=Yoonia sediminilitoris TaxID=1286148 RepID=A0A2T6KQX8_9RHOB|nr:ABC transporter ATP-binding protein [Yoonia sediminilitoris]PUB18935.1 nitrate/nitrite transport system ATP-binding protein [Yoonia sediminilitoris]RCW99103.1 nitrate/nitrite transport system ATP-binding protein [Yoonia sediminilitoris]